MSRPARTTVSRSVIVLGVLAVLAVGGWSLLRNPVSFDENDSTEPRNDPAPANSAVVERPARPSEAYAGSNACADCHAEIFKLYQSHPMAQSLAHVSDAEPIEDYVDNPEFLFPPSTHVDVRVRYYVERREDCDYHHEVAFLPGSGELYDQTVPVQYEVGSGQRGRSYLTNRLGLLFMSPITWYSQRHRWDMSPGYIFNNQHFERRILDGCVTCHAGRMARIDGRPNCYDAAKPFLEMSIGCERCHGPGQEHIAIHRGQPVDGGRDPIVNPIDLEPARRDAVCIQCHLPGEERIPRYGRTHFDFRPGDHVIDTWTVFIKGTGMRGDQTTGAVSQVEQMLASTCYRKSDGRFGCVSCHDPHSIPAPENRLSFYRDRCLECHGNTDRECSQSLERRRNVTPDDSCIDCHMPRIAANDVPHTSQTDHRVLRSYHGEPPAEREPGLRIFEDGTLPEAERDRALGMMLAMRGENVREFSVFAGEAISKLEPWVAVVPDDRDAAEMLGAACMLVDDVDRAYSIWKQILEEDPDNENVLKRLMVTCDEYDRPDEALVYARRLVELNPWDQTYQGRLAHMLARRGEYDEAIRAGERAVEVRPSDFWVHGWLAEVYRLAGKPQLAKEHEVARDLFAPKERP
jgi:Doubled CXXCH motif (Paired_CXXCH_1)/Cytochrome c554 and c-prime